jgi:hypothetical protein
VSTLIEIVEAMATALAPIGTTIDGLQVLPYLNGNPTPPSIDIYPGTPFQTGSGFGDDDQELFFTVRARTTFADSVAGQQGLYRLLDPSGPESVQHHLEADQTLGGIVQTLAVVEEGVTGFTEYVEDTQTGGRLVGCEWRVRVIT